MCKCENPGLDKAFNAVKAFHTAFNAPVGKEPAMLLPSRVNARADWMNEEVKEFLHALTLEDQADAMIDLIYFAVGTLVELGIKPQPLFDIVQHANMSKLFPDGKPHYREDGKIIKPPTWVAPEPKIREEIQRQINEMKESN